MRIVVVAVGTRGDVEPHAALCAGLLDAGYDARLCAPIDEAALLAQRNLPFDPIPVSFRRFCESGDGNALLSTGGNAFRFLRDLRRAGSEIAAGVVAGIRAACSGADAVCYSPLGMPALFLAREMGIPAIATGLQPLGRTREHASPLLPLPHWAPGAANKLSYRVVEQLFWRAMRPLIGPHLRATMPTRAHFDDMYVRSTPVLFGYSSHVVPRPRDWKPWMYATGYWTTASEQWEPPRDLARFLAAGPAVCVGFGSMQGPRVKKIVDVALDTLARTGRRAVVLTGWNGDAIRPAKVSENVFFIDAVPHDWLFARVSAVIHHGGAGTTAAALRAGCPSVIVPFFFDQGFWGRWLAARGLGPEPIARLSPNTLGRALDLVEGSAQMQSRLQSLSGLLREEDGVRKAVTILSEVFERNAGAHLQPQF